MPVVGRPARDAETLDSKPGQLLQVVSICIRHPQFRSAAASADEDDVFAVRRIVRIVAGVPEAGQNHRRSCRQARGSKRNRPDARPGNVLLRGDDPRRSSLSPSYRNATSTARPTCRPVRRPHPLPIPGFVLPPRTTAACCRPTLVIPGLSHPRGRLPAHPVSPSRHPASAPAAWRWSEKTDARMRGTVRRERTRGRHRQSHRPVESSGSALFRLPVASGTRWTCLTRAIARRRRSAHHPGSMPARKNATRRISGSVRSGPPCAGMTMMSPLAARRVLTNAI